MRPLSPSGTTLPPAPSAANSSLRSARNRDRGRFSLRGETPSRQAVWTALHELQRRHKLPFRSFHALRHFFLTALVRGGANLEAVRELAGHSKLHTTQRSVRATGADLRDAISRLPGN